MPTLNVPRRGLRFGFIAALLALLPLAALAQTTDGSNGSATQGSASNGSASQTTEGSTASASGTTASGTTSYDAPLSYNLGGGTVSLATAILNGGTVTNGTLAVATEILGYSGSVTASLTGSASLTKSTTDTLTLAGANSYTGNTTVAGGKLLLNGSLGTTSVLVNNGATLGGTGSFGGTTTLSAGGILAPGDSVGTLTFTNGLTLDAGAVLNFDLGTTSDLIRISGGLLTGPGTGTVTLNLTNAGSFGAATYTLFDFTGATTSSFDTTDFTFGSTLTGYTYGLAFNGSTLELTVSAIPEPATYAAISGALLLGFVLLRRRRHLVRPRP
jgi:autotransporter-associated beta strand protein